MLDGILAVTHPELYQASQDLMAKIWRNHGVSWPVLSIWPSCFTSLQVIANRSTPGHRDNNAHPGWLDMLLTLGMYGKRAVLELRGLGISLPYAAGSIVPITAQLLLHAVPEVRGDRICYAFSMHSDLFTRFKVPLVGMASVLISEDEEGVEAGSQGRLSRLAQGISNRLSSVASSVPGGSAASRNHPVAMGRVGDSAVHDDEGDGGESDVSAHTDGEDEEMAEA